MTNPEQPDPRMGELPSDLQALLYDSTVALPGERRVWSSVYRWLQVKQETAFVPEPMTKQLVWFVDEKPDPATTAA